MEIPASITAVEFYRKFGYDYKNGEKELDEEHHYRLEKIVKAEKYEYNKVDHKMYRIKIKEIKVHAIHMLSEMFNLSESQEMA